MQVPLVSGSNIKTINSESLLGSTDIAVQVPLVSGTNIKTINGNDLVGAGDLTISAAMTVDLLWTNASPSTSFAAQTLNVPDLHLYSLIAIIVKESAAATAYVTSFYTNEALRNRISFPIDGYAAIRAFTISTDDIAFENASRFETYTAGLTTNNSMLIPYQIIGIK